MVFIMQNYTNHFELLIGQFYFVENKAASSETALFIFEGDLSYPLHIHGIGTQCPYYSRSYRNHYFENFIPD
jgi:hypothetical protein